MPCKTRKEIDAEIAELEQLLPRIRQFDAFGGDNKHKLALQITVLKKAWSEDDIYSHEYESDDESSALEAVYWRNGDAEESLSEGWKPLAVQP